MDIHQNARLARLSRAELVRRVVEQAIAPMGAPADMILKWIEENVTAE